MSEIPYAEEYAEEIKLSEECAVLYRDAFLEGRVKFDFSGHFFSSDDQRMKQCVEQKSGWWGHFFSSYTFSFYHHKPMLERMIEAVKFNSAISDSISLQNTRQCYKCGETVSWETDGQTIRAHVFVPSKQPSKRLGDFLPIPCKYATGAPTKAVHYMDVPSGKIVMGCILHRIFDDKKIWADNGAEQYNHQFSISNIDGTLNYMQRYAEHELLTAFVGGGSLQVYANETCIALRRNRESLPDAIKCGKHTLSHVANIALSLRWYGAADLQKCQQLNAEVAAKIDDPPSDDHGTYYDDELFAVTVEPGRYRRTHYISRVDKGSKDILSVIERVRK